MLFGSAACHLPSSDDLRQAESKVTSECRSEAADFKAFVRSLVDERARQIQGALAEAERAAIRIEGGLSLASRKLDVLIDRPQPEGGPVLALCFCASPLNREGIMVVTGRPDRLGETYELSPGSGICTADYGITTLAGTQYNEGLYIYLAHAGNAPYGCPQAPRAQSMDAGPPKG